VSAHVRTGVRLALGCFRRRSHLASLALGLAALALLLTGCSGMNVPPEHALTYTYAVPTGTTFDLRRGEPVPAEALAARLAGVRLLFLGENHTEPDSHAFQREVIARLADAGRTVSIALEMFPPEVDPVLEDWRQGRLDELTFLERSLWYRHWGFAWAHYRALFELIRDRHLALYGVNATRTEREAVAKDHTAELPAELRELLGDLDAVIPPQRAYLLDTLRAVGHGGDLRPESDSFRRLQRVQRMWDRLMGVRAARLAERQPAGGITVLLLGSGHLAWGLGANLQARRESALPQLTVWDTLAAPAELDAQGRYAVPLGIADWARVYARAGEAPDGPSLSALRLEPDAQGVRVRAVSAFAGPELHALQADDVIVTLDGTAPRSPTALRLAYERELPGKAAHFSILRKGQRMELEVIPPANTR
jgi:uncharacterized iron-regulated protein